MQSPLAPATDSPLPQSQAPICSCCDGFDGSEVDRTAGTLFFEQPPLEPGQQLSPPARSTMPSSFTPGISCYRSYPRVVVDRKSAMFLQVVVLKLNYPSEQEEGIAKAINHYLPEASAYPVVLLL